MSEVSMSMAAGAWLAAIAGAVTGIFALHIRRTSSGSTLLGGLAGAIIGALAYGAFIITGMAVSVLTFSSAPDGWPALLSVIVGCAILLIARGIHSALAPRFGMLARRTPPQPRTFTDLIDARPRGGSATMWLGGVGLALLPLIYGISCIVTRQGELGTLIWPSEVQGAAAIALGVGWIGVGLFLHFHFFFGLHAVLAPYSRRGKSIALVLACAGLTVAGSWSIVAQVPF